MRQFFTVGHCRKVGSRVLVCMWICCVGDHDVLWQRCNRRWLKAKLDNFFGLTLSLWCITWLNGVTVVKKWHHLLLHWSPISPVFVLIFFLPLGWEFAEKWKISDALRTLCPNSPVFAALLTHRWRWYELISSPCSDSLELWQTSLLRCKFTHNHLISVQTGLKERERQQAK